MMMTMRETESGGSRLDGLPGPTTSKNYQPPNLGSESVGCRSPPTDISLVSRGSQRTSHQTQEWKEQNCNLSSLRTKKKD